MYKCSTNSTYCTTRTYSAPCLYVNNTTYLFSNFYFTSTIQHTYSATFSLCQQHHTCTCVVQIVLTAQHYTYSATFSLHEQTTILIHKQYLFSNMCYSEQPATFKVLLFPTVELYFDWRNNQRKHNWTSTYAKLLFKTKKTWLNKYLFSTTF